MNQFLVLAFLFFIGSTIGWIIELLFRRFFSSKKWINPGFLVGPYLPLYGCGVIGLYLISSIDLSIINNSILESFIIIIIMAVVMILIEYLTGLYFLKIMKIRLWDYTNRFGNIQGLICPLFSLFWIIIGTIYYFFIHPSIIDALTWLANHLSFSFVLGFFYGILIIDVFYSFKLSSKIKSVAKELNIVIKYENLKESIHNHLEETKEKISFLLPFKTNISFKDIINKYKDRFIKKD